MLQLDFSTDFESEKTGSETYGVIGFSLPCFNPLSIEMIIQNFLRKSILAPRSLPEELLLLITRFITLDTFGTSFKVPENVEDGRYTKISITKSDFTATILKKNLDSCSFGDLLTCTESFPDNKLSSMTITYKHNLPTLTVDKYFGKENNCSPTTRTVVVVVIGIRGIDDNVKPGEQAEYMILNRDDKRNDDICFKRAFKVIKKKKACVKTQIICDFKNKNKKTITFIVNGKKLIPYVPTKTYTKRKDRKTKNQNYTFDIKKEHENVKLTPFIYCRLFMECHFPQWKYGGAFVRKREIVEDKQSSSEEDEVENIN